MKAPVSPELGDVSMAGKCENGDAGDASVPPWQFQFPQGSPNLSCPSVMPQARPEVWGHPDVPLTNCCLIVTLPALAVTQQPPEGSEELLKTQPTK